MTLLQIFFIISGLIISIIALSIARRERFNALHFLVFLAVGVGLCIFGFFPGSLDRIARIAWVARGADALVYASVVFLFYFVLLLLQKVESQRQDITKLIRSIALDSHHHEKK